MTTDQPRADVAALDDLVERWHAWNATDDPDLKVMLGLGLMQDAFDALPSLAALAPADPTADLTERWRQMRYHPDLKGKSDEYIAGWDAATRAALAASTTEDDHD